MAGKDIGAKISILVHSFVQIRNGFEADLAEELAATEKRGINFKLNVTYQIVRWMGAGLIEHNMTMVESSGALSIPLSTATRVVEQLVEESYVQRLADLADRRIVRVAFTEQSRTLYKLMDEYIARRIRR